MDKITPSQVIKNLKNSANIDSVECDEDIEIKEFLGGTNINRITNSVFQNFSFPKLNSPELHITNTKIERLQFKEGSMGKVYITNCVIKDIITFQQFKINTELFIINCNIETLELQSQNHGIVRIEENTIKKISINCHVNSVFIKSKIDSKTNALAVNGQIHSFEIDDMKVENMSLEQGGTVNCKRLSVSGFLQVRSGNSDVTFDDCNIEKMHFETLSYCKIYGGVFKEIKFLKPFNYLSTFKGKADPNSDCVIGTLDLAETTGMFSIANAQIDNIILNGFKASEAKLRFVIVNKSILMEDTVMENAKFHNVNLSRAEIRFLDSSLSGSELINVGWPQRFYEYSKDLKGKNTNKRLNYLYPLKEGYRQIKVLLLNQNNKIDALAFHKHEVKIYWQIVNLKLFSRKHFSRRDIGNWLILFTNRIFSDFGQSFGLPLLWLFVVHSILFYVLLQEFPLGLKLDPFDFEWNATWKGLGMYLNLLSPVHNNEIRNPWLNFSEPPVSIYGTIDFFMRLLNAYFIYYFIRATRKFNISL